NSTPPFAIGPLKLPKCPLVKSSTTRTFAPRARSWSVSVEPINDAPPVTRTSFPVQNVSAGFTLSLASSVCLSGRNAAHYFYQFLHFVASIIAPRRFFRRRAHLFQSVAVRGKVSNRSCEF